MKYVYRTECTETDVSHRVNRLKTPVCRGESKAHKDPHLFLRNLSNLVLNKFIPSDFITSSGSLFHSSITL